MDRFSKEEVLICDYVNCYIFFSISIGKEISISFNVDFLKEYVLRESRRYFFVSQHVGTTL